MWRFFWLVTLTFVHVGQPLPTSCTDTRRRFTLSRFANDAYFTVKNSSSDEKEAKHGRELSSMQLDGSAQR
eukprot:CAMPEP_0194058744 /NCGR_PEP_ID=MMETSP0009_2-20130614/67122_1 /TAXON_ID=210454 /ORGANISM="Grammatophora oceanica, Strain CCMP 410" /LENGTH=70 /DNA_ID=CAMNT_0038709027 /DNA_START=61 /DNA_END=270 /DNA_ORIENTATION=+